MTCYPRLASGDRPFSRSPESIKSNSISCYPLDQSLFAYYDRILHWLKQPLTLLVNSLSIASKTILLVLFTKTTSWSQNMLAIPPFFKFGEKKT